MGHFLENCMKIENLKFRFFRIFLIFSSNFQIIRHFVQFLKNNRISKFWTILNNLKLNFKSCEISFREIWEISEKSGKYPRNFEKSKNLRNFKQKSEKFKKIPKISFFNNFPNFLFTRIRKSWKIPKFWIILEIPLLREFRNSGIF